MCVYVYCLHVCIYTFISVCVHGVGVCVCVCVDVLVFAGMTHVEVRRQLIGVIALNHVDPRD